MPLYVKQLRTLAIKTCTAADKTLYLLKIPVDNEPHQPTQRSRVLGTSKWGNRSVFYTNPALDGDPALSPPHPHEGAAIGGKFCGLWRLVRDQKPRPLARVLRVG